MDLGLRLEIKEGRHCGSRPFMFTLHRENVLCQYNLIGDLYWSFYPKPEPLIKYSGPCFTTFGYSLIVTSDWKKVSNISTFYAKCHHNTILVACQSIHLKQNRAYISTVPSLSFYRRGNWGSEKTSFVYKGSDA